MFDTILKSFEYLTRMLRCAYIGNRPGVLKCVNNMFVQHPAKPNYVLYIHPGRLLVVPVSVANKEIEAPAVSAEPQLVNRVAASHPRAIGAFQTRCR